MTFFNQQESTTTLIQRQSDREKKALLMSLFPSN
jgi:hypothetical protein